MKKRSKSETFKKVIIGNKMIIKLNGRIDAEAAEFEKKLQEDLRGVDKLVFDFKTVDSITSAGLRVLSSTQKSMKKHHGNMVIRNASDEVREYFEATGFDEILTIEDRKHRIAS